MFITVTIYFIATQLLIIHAHKEVMKKLQALAEAENKDV